MGLPTCHKSQPKCDPYHNLEPPGRRPHLAPLVMTAPVGLAASALLCPICKQHCADHLIIALTDDGPSGGVLADDWLKLRYVLFKDIMTAWANAADDVAGAPQLSPMLLRLDERDPDGILLKAWEWGAEDDETESKLVSLCDEVDAFVEAFMIERLSGIDKITIASAGEYSRPLRLYAKNPKAATRRLKLALQLF